MIENFKVDFVEPEDEDEEFDELDYDPKKLGNTVELSDKGFSQKMVQEMNQNQLKILKLKLENLIKEKKQIKQHMKENQTQTPNTSTNPEGNQ